MTRNIPTVQEHDLVVAGLRSTIRQDNVCMWVENFLHEVFAPDHSPIRYKDNIILEGTAADGRVLKLTFALDYRNGGTDIDKAYLQFCTRLVDGGRKADRMWSILSDFGLLGFSPQSDRLRVPWHQAVFSWMNERPDAKIKEVDSMIALIGKESSSKEAVPAWAGAAAMSIIMGVTQTNTHSLGMGFELKTYSEASISSAMTLLQDIGTYNEALNASIRARAAAKVASEHCEAMMSTTRSTADLLKNQPKDQVARKAAHFEALLGTIKILEEGGQAVASCKKAVQGFEESYNKDMHVAIGEAVRVGFQGRETIGVTNLFSDLTAAVRAGSIQVDAGFLQFLRVFWWLSWICWILNIINLGLTALGMWVASRERQKWKTAATYTKASIVHATQCEIFLRWSYAVDDPTLLTDEQRDMLKAQAEAMHLGLPDGEDKMSGTIRANLMQYGKTLEGSIEPLRQLLE